MRIRFLYINMLALSFIALGSCNFFDKNTKKIDVSGIDLEIDIERFDQSFFSADTVQLYADLSKIRMEDSVFFDFYTENVMRFGKISDSLTPTMLDLHHFFTNLYVLDLYDTVQYKYQDLSLFKEELTQAMKHYTYYFPENQMPQFKSIISEFGYNVVALDDEYIAIALDMYLGKNYKYYGSFDFPYYIIDRFEPEYIVPNVMEVLYGGIYEKAQFNSEALIHAMIENGKKLYFMECMQPEKSKHLFIGYSKEQLDWCENAEGEIWKFYNEHDLFYEVSLMEHSRHVNDGPTTAGMPAGAPGNVGSWVGWQIVNQYVENNPEDISLEQLLNTSAKDILAKSNYKPK